ncbi:Lysine-specific demethylase 8 [Sphaceloma murrayae]|uniref:Lysine-specific demethylase 8 n=1 Tax=Sphaceloma murrayae TaxID=2082308 RepID=A0A2K1QRJ8_9PEZI|nr:Lysine-specific demethylase 8 [Sphaceloma murrayae]
MTKSPTEALIDLLDSYNSFNAACVDVLQEEPSPLEFMRYVALNRPFVVRLGAREWTASQAWSAAYLTRVMRDQRVQVATTPFGNADAVLKDPITCQKIFVEPLEQYEPFDQVLQYIVAHGRGDIYGPVKYLQTQNDNLREEYAPLFDDVPRSIPFARIALQKDPDAVNFWLGNQTSVTALHKDNYQNVYAQIRGRKHFILLPPVAAPAAAEAALGLARYEQHRPDGTGEDFGLRAVLVQPEESVPVPTWNPFTDKIPPNDFGKHIVPLHVTLHEGDMMYLPAMWYHAVRQSTGDEGFSCSVNYWLVATFGRYGYLS